MKFCDRTPPTLPRIRPILARSHMSTNFGKIWLGNGQTWTEVHQHWPDDDDVQPIWSEIDQVWPVIGGFIEFGQTRPEIGQNWGHLGRRNGACLGSLVEEFVERPEEVVDKRLSRGKLASSDVPLDHPFRCVLGSRNSCWRWFGKLRVSTESELVSTSGWARHCSG